MNIDDAANPSEAGLADKFCWKCDKKCQSKSKIACRTCERSFHVECFKKIGTLDERQRSVETCNICTEVQKYELIPAAYDWIAEKLDNSAYDALKDLSVMRNSDKRRDITYFIDLDQINNNLVYRSYDSWNAFTVDIEYIVRNCTIFYGQYHTVTMVAKKLRNDVEPSLCCIECFNNKLSHPNAWFSLACDKPHLLLWVKLRRDMNIAKAINAKTVKNTRFTHWPAKIMSMAEKDMVQVVFFGFDDIEMVKPNECSLFTKNVCYTIWKTFHKTNKTQGEPVLKMVHKYIVNVQEKFGRMNENLPNTPFDDASFNEHMKAMYPEYSVSNCGVDQNESDNVIPYKRPHFSKRASNYFKLKCDYDQNGLSEMGTAYDSDLETDSCQTESDSLFTESEEIEQPDDDNRNEIEHITLSSGNLTNFDTEYLDDVNIEENVLEMPHSVNLSDLETEDMNSGHKNDQMFGDTQIDASTWDEICTMTQELLDKSVDYDLCLKSIPMIILDDILRGAPAFNEILENPTIQMSTDSYDQHSEGVNLEIVRLTEQLRVEKEKRQAAENELILTKVTYETRITEQATEMKRKLESALAKADKLVYEVMQLKTTNRKVKESNRKIAGENSQLRSEKLKLMEVLNLATKHCNDKDEAILDQKERIANMEIERGKDKDKLTQLRTQFDGKNNKIDPLKCDFDDGKLGSFGTGNCSMMEYSNEINQLNQSLMESELKLEDTKRHYSDELAKMKQMQADRDAKIVKRERDQFERDRRGKMYCFCGNHESNYRCSDDCKDIWKD